MCLEEGQVKTSVGIIWPIAQQCLGDAYPKPVVVEGYNGSVYVQVAVIDGTDQAQRERAIEMARGVAPHVLCGAIVINSANADPQVLNTLVQTCDVVVLASADKSIDAAQRLVRILTLPSEPNVHWCTDWNDVHAIATKPRAVKPARHVSARARGLNASTVAEKAVHDVVPEHPVNALILVSAGKGVRGAQVKQVHSTVRAHLYPGSTIVKSTVTDASLAEDEIALDILVFGSLPAECLGYAALPALPACNRVDSDALDIPTFLRKPTP